MTITLIQADLYWENKGKNLKNLEHIILGSSPDSDLIILPEMFNTGFSMNTLDMAEQEYSYTYEWMANIAAKYNSGVCGSYIIHEDNKYFNRWIFVSPEKEMHKYDKRHLFSLSNENIHYTAGNKRTVFNYRGVRICPIICYDLRFPVWSRNRNDYDLLINSANWPESRRNVWITLLKARAIENQCYVAGVNRIGTDGTGIKYCGDSIIVNPKGEIIASDINNKECTVSSEISMPELADFRQKFPVLKDAENFTISH
jgi:omega-amidase